MNRRAQLLSSTSITKTGVAETLREFKRGQLRSGSKTGPEVTNPRQALAIALHEREVTKGLWDESKHPRDHGKFASTVGQIDEQQRPQDLAHERQATRRQAGVAGMLLGGSLGMAAGHALLPRRGGLWGGLALGAAGGYLGGRAGHDKVFGGDVRKGLWDETKHPRDHGRFTAKEQRQLDAAERWGNLMGLYGGAMAGSYLGSRLAPKVYAAGVKAGIKRTGYQFKTTEGQRRAIHSAMNRGPFKMNQTEAAAAVRHAARANFFSGALRAAQATKTGMLVGGMVAGAAGLGAWARSHKEQQIRKALWDESKHPRDHGRFAESAGQSLGPKTIPHGGRGNTHERETARRAGAIGDALGSTLGGLAGGLAGGGFASAATGFAGSTAGGMAGRALFERGAFAAQAPSLRAAWHRFRAGVPERKTGVGEILGGTVGAYGGAQAATRLLRRAPGPVGTATRLATTVAGTATGEVGGSWLGRRFDKRDAFNLDVDFCKRDDEERIVYGFASVIEDNGKVVTDRQGDQIPVAELVKAAHNFMLNSRTGGQMHVRKGSQAVKIGDVVESVVLRPELQQALGIDLKKTAWLIGVKVADDEVWDRVKKGELRAFSIGGRGKRKKLD